MSPGARRAPGCTREALGLLCSHWILGSVGLRCVNRSLSKITPVAVGAVIADRPRTDPYERCYRIRLLPWVRALKRTFVYGCKVRGVGIHRLLS
jgi:hypothetical protein